MHPEGLAGGHRRLSEHGGVEARGGELSAEEGDGESMCKKVRG